MLSDLDKIKKDLNDFQKRYKNEPNYPDEFMAFVTEYLDSCISHVKDFDWDDYRDGLVEANAGV